jgi:hypothetical protein
MSNEQRVLKHIEDAIALLATVEQTATVEVTIERLTNIAEDFATAEAFKQG